MQKTNITNRINSLVDYLSKGLYGQEFTLKQLLLFALAERKVEVEGNDKVLNNIVSSRVLAVFKEFYETGNLSLPVKGHLIMKKRIPIIPETNFFDFITKDIDELTPTEEQKSLFFTIDEINKLQTEVKKIGLSDGVKRLLLFNRAEKVDTEWNDIVHVLQMSAYLNGRDTVYLVDVLPVIEIPALRNTEYYNYYTSYKFFEFIDINSYFKHKGWGDGWYFDENSFCEDSKSLDYLCQLIVKFYKTSDICTEEPKEASAVNKLKLAVQENSALILTEIENRFSKLENYRKELDCENIFSENNDKNNLLSIVNGHVEDLENVKNRILSKVEEIKFNFVKDVDIGDCIFKDGNHKKYSEIKTVDKWGNTQNININKSELISVICLKGDTSDSIYGISSEGWKEKTFDEAQNIAETYKAKESQVYSKDWIIPSITQLEEIFKNKEKLKKEALDFELSGKFWSSTKKGDDAVYFFDFDKGTKDYTTTDHKYNLALLHRFGE